MDLKLTGKVALITGASRGLGAASARLLAMEGAHLVLTARTVDTLNETASAIRAASNVQVVTHAEDLVAIVITVDDEGDETVLGDADGR